MNQAIIFSDNEQYNIHSQQVEFQAQSQGALMSCVISLSYLQKLNKITELTSEQCINVEKTALTLFDNVRFDIEDLAEEMINQQAFSEDGKVYLHKA
ncbi:DUF1488 domain-containing protein [Psychromonas sp. SP041]|uniref:DUF1488 domain-containing protein n=1 Tax=Psychromonas sp. SP041 TaxID=1365007 RepID=UPI0010C78E96|nr:DUF1488 domain-containing protein [Psychromonas sp. SP041]